MHAHWRPSLTTVIRLLAAATVLAFALSAVSLAYAAGRYSSGPDAHGVAGPKTQPVEPTTVVLT